MSVDEVNDGRLLVGVDERVGAGRAAGAEFLVELDREVGVTGLEDVTDAVLVLRMEVLLELEE